MKTFLLIFFMMVVTFGVRYPVLALVGRINLPIQVERALKFVPVAVLSALSAPIVLINDGTWNISLNNGYLIASIVAILVALKTKNLLLTIIIGMAAFALMKLV